MPTTIPNFFANQQTPLGAAFANLSQVLAARPTDQQNMAAADAATLSHRKVQGQQSLADRFQQLYAPQAPVTAPAVASAPPVVNVPEAPVGMPDGAPTPRPDPSAPSPIASAFGQLAQQVQPTIQTPAPAGPTQPDFGGLIHDAIFAGMDPKNLGGLNLFGAANSYGATDPRTQNAQVGDGQTYENTFGALDRKQTDTATQAAAKLKNASDINAANIQKDYGVESMKEHHADAQGAADATELDAPTIKYLADQVRNGAALPALGMGKQAAAMRSAILKQAAADDTAAGRTGTDAATAKVDFAGHLAGSRTLGNREATSGTAVNELAGIIPTTKALIGTVARSGLYPVDVILNAAQHGTNDPQLAKLAVSLNDAVNAHARAINPQGQVTDSGRAQGYQMLNQVQDPEAMGAALDQMMVGAQRALAAPGQTRNQMHDSMRGTLGENAPAGGEEHWVRGPNGQLQRAQ